MVCHSPGGYRQEPVWRHLKEGLRRNLERPFVQRCGPGHQVGMRANSVRGRPLTGVGRPDTGVQPVFIHPVPRGEPQRERVARRRPDGAGEHHRGLVPGFQAPLHAEGETVQGAASVGFIDRHLVVDAVEGVFAVADPVGPRGGDDAAEVGNGPAGREREDQVPPPVAQLAEGRSPFRDDGGVLPRPDPVFLPAHRPPASL